MSKKKAKRTSKPKAQPRKSRNPARPPAKKPPSTPPASPARSDYDAIKAAAGQRNQKISLAGRDCGPIAEIVDPERRAACQLDFRLFCETYFSAAFTLAWSDDHLKVIAKIERAVIEGGLFALAMPRSSGKTTLCETACLWAVLYGHRRFVFAIGAEQTSAEEMLDSMKIELESNDLLADDFPKVCQPIAALDGIANRCSGQHVGGVRTHISWQAKEVQLPTVAGSIASGAVITCAGLTSRIRGKKAKLVDGTPIRPDLVILDDPQTDKSAHSVKQCQTRERILAGAVLGLAGPGEKIAGIMPCTVITPDDMADRILDREQHPQWQGERTQMVYSFPSNEKLWDEYGTIRADGLRAGNGLKSASAFYKKNRKAMDTGAKIAWPANYNHDEVSGVQHAMNLKLQDEEAFWAEYQNQPLAAAEVVEQIDADAIADKKRQSGYSRGQIPPGVRWLTSYTDVHDSLLYWMICGWSENATGWIVDYGTFPEQKTSHFQLRSAQATLGRKYQGRGKDAAVYAGLIDHFNGHLLRRFETEAGELLGISKALADMGYMTSTVEDAIRAAEHRNLIVPAKGLGIKALNKPFSEYITKRGDRRGLHWRSPVPRRGQLRQTQIDTNFWKSFARNRLMTPMQETGCVWLFKSRTHRLLAEHFTAERFDRVEAAGRVVEEWTNPKNADNHWWDCFVGNLVAANLCGAVLAGAGGSRAKRAKKKTVRLSELQAERRAGR